MKNMFKNTKFKKAFTLVELLIVVIIIGILMNALLPKLMWAQAGARDTARKVDLANINTALIQYMDDKWTYPTWECVSALTGSIKSYIRLIPNDPQSSRIAYWTKRSWCTWWVYGYTSLKANWADDVWSVLVANLEKFWKKPNWVLTWNYKNSADFTTGDDVKDLYGNICKSVIESSGSSTICDEDTKEWATSEQNQMVFVIFNG